MPKISEIDDTPNPNAVKFTLHEPLTWGISHSYENAEEAKSDHLASKLFSIAHVSNVFYVDRWLTVTQDGGADWSELVRQIAIPIREAPAAAAQSAAAVFNARASVGDMSAIDQARFEILSALLNERIRPSLQADGGDLHLVGLSGNSLSIHYQGACGSCPSSISGTLSAIQNLVRTIDPDLTVIAI